MTQRHLKTMTGSYLGERRSHFQTPVPSSVQRKGRTKAKDPILFLHVFIASYSAVHNSNQRRAGQDTVEMSVEGTMYIYFNLCT